MAPASRLTGLVADTGNGSTGAAGTIQLDADGVGLANRRPDLWGVVRGEGDGGQIRITAGSLTATGQIVQDGPVFPSAVLAFSESGSRADAGSIAVAADQIGLANGARVSAETRGSGKGGSVDLQVGALTATGGFSTGTELISSAVAAAASEAPAPPARCRSRRTPSCCRTAARSSAAPSGPGRAAASHRRRHVRATGGFLDADGFSFPSGVFASAERAAPAPAAPSASPPTSSTCRTGGRVTGSTLGQGDGGQVQVSADRITIGREGVLAGRVLGSGILAAAEQGSTGSAGTVAVQGGDITVRTGGSISGRSASPGEAGEVAVAARRSVTIEGGSDRDQQQRGRRRRRRAGAGAAGGASATTV